MPIQGRSNARLPTYVVVMAVLLPYFVRAMFAMAAAALILAAAGYALAIVPRNVADGLELVILVTFSSLIIALVAMYTIVTSHHRRLLHGVQEAERRRYAALSITRNYGKWIWGVPGATLVVAGVYVTRASLSSWAGWTLIIIGIGLLFIARRVASPSRDGRSQG
jgi:hypothetical protein